MPASMKERKIKGKKVFDVVADGKLVKRHKTRAKAVAHVQGKNLGELRSKGRKGVPPAPKRRKRK
jgi:hypothetical protein